MRKSSYEIMVSDENFELDRKSAADAFNMNIMQCFGAEIPDFVQQLEDLKGKFAESLRESSPELADKIGNYKFKPQDYIEILNSTIAESFKELKEIKAENIETMENINNELSN